MEELYLNYCHIRDAGLHIIHRTITSSLASSITIEKLWLYNNDLSSSSDGCLADIVITCGVKLLGISNNKTIGQTEEFFPTILSPSSSMIEITAYNWYTVIQYSSHLDIYSTEGEEDKVEEAGLWLTMTSLMMLVTS